MAGSHEMKSPCGLLFLPRKEDFAKPVIFARRASVQALFELNREDAATWMAIHRFYGSKVTKLETKTGFRRRLRIEDRAKFCRRSTKAPSPALVEAYSER